MLVVAALGGNALLKRGEPLTAEAQRENVRVAALSPMRRTASSRDVAVSSVTASHAEAATPGASR